MSSSNKRERELARQKFERQQQRRLQQEAARKRRNQILAVVAGLVVVAGAVVAVVLSTRDSGSSQAASSPTPTPAASTVAGCTTPPTPTTKTASWKAPGTTPPAASTITLTTNCGDVIISTDKVKAPKTVQSMTFLTAQGYFTDSDCFRLTTSGIFVFQCGSPTNNGQGGPGYQIPDENLPTSAGSDGYPRGTVAMANSGANTNGSQFFLVYEDGTKLGPNYTIWGTVVSGLEMLQRVAAAGVQGGGTDGKPVQPLVITKATVG